MPGFIYAQDRQGAIYVNLYVSSETAFKVARQRHRAVGRERDAVGRHSPTITVSTRDDATRARSSCAFRDGRATSPLPAGSTPTRTARTSRRRSSVNGKSVDARRRTGSATSRSIGCGRTATSIDDRVPDRGAERRRRSAGDARIAGASRSNAGRSSTARSGPTCDGRARAGSAARRRRAELKPRRGARARRRHGHRAPRRARMSNRRAAPRRSR